MEQKYQKLSSYEMKGDQIVINHHIFCLSQQKEKCIHHCISKFNPILDR